MKKEEPSIELMLEMFNAYNAGDKNLDSFQDCVEKRTLLSTTSGGLTKKLNDFFSTYTPNQITNEEIDNYKSILLNSTDDDKIDILKEILDNFEMTYELKYFLSEYKHLLLKIKNNEV
jgi:hypothetical protein